MILDISGCSDPGLGFILKIIKTFFTIIEVIAPIVLIVSLFILFTKLVSDPDNKKLINNVKNAIIACVIIFLIPFIVNLVMLIIGEKYTFSECWNSAYTSSGSGKYIEKKTDNSKENKPTKVYTEASEYVGEVTLPIGNASSIADLACSVAGTFAPEPSITNNTGNPADHWVRISDPRVQRYQNIMDAVARTGNGHDNPAYCSCTQAAAAIIRATVDRNFWMISPDDALAYMEQSPNWKFIGLSDNLSAAQLQPGDVMGHSGHTMIWVSNAVAQKYKPGTTGNIYEAGYTSYSYPGITQHENGNIKGGFRVYRFVGTPDPGCDASKYLT